MSEFTESLIQEKLATALLDKGHRMVVPNPETLNGGYSESDLVSVTQAQVVHEYEIKCTRGDYLAELRAFEERGSYGHAKRAKHLKMRDVRNNDGNYSSDGMPQKFWIVCPAGLVDPDELPGYWGLYELDDETFDRTVTPNPIHNEKATYDTILDLSRYLTSRYWRDY